MNYFIYNNLNFSYNQISFYQISGKNISLELILSSNESTFQTWEMLKENLNLTFYFYNKNDNFNFILKESYLKNNILILKGELL